MRKTERFLTPRLAWIAAALLASGILAGCGLISSGNEAAIRKAYQDYQAAVQKQDPAALKPLVAREHAARFDGEGITEMLKIQKELTPDDVEILGIEVQGNKAVLEAQGTKDGQTMTARVDFVKEDGQ